MPKFQKRHYIVMATQINELYGDASNAEMKSILMIMANAMSDMFQRDNPNFNREKFIEACTSGAEINA
jgi:hypothetical protein